MRILATDVGTGTQDVLLFDTDKEPENALKMVMPSPTRLVAGAIAQATRYGEDLLLTGVTMGGGPCAWAAEEHIKAGLRVFATPAAARTFNDDLEEVAARGVTVVSQDEIGHLAGVRRLTMVDYNYDALSYAFAAFGVDLDSVEVLAIAVFDHGAAPPGVSDRQFRFDYLAEQIQKGSGLAGLAYEKDNIPAIMTRLQAAASSAPQNRPLVMMDTAPAAVLGALEDPVVREQRDSLVANIGNMHTLAFHLREGAIAGLFEHHTGRLDRTKLESLMAQLAAGTLSHEALFAEHGHGAFVADPAPSPLEFVALTGPRRGMMVGSSLQPYLAVPYGDMMMTGCWGLIRACAQVLPWTALAIEGALGPQAI